MPTCISCFAVTCKLLVHRMQEKHNSCLHVDYTQVFQETIHFVTDLFEKSVMTPTLVIASELTQKTTLTNSKVLLDLKELHTKRAKNASPSYSSWNSQAATHCIKKSLGKN